MEIYEPLPTNLKFNFKEAVGPAIREQLDYLWKAAHAVTSKDLAHSLARRFVEVGDKHGLHYPEEVKRRLCSWCSNILIPSVTATIRIRPRGRRSKRKVVVKSRKTDHDGNAVTSLGNSAKQDRHRKMKNQIVTHCNQCRHVSSVTSGCYRTPKTTPKSIAAEGSSSVSACAVVETNVLATTSISNSSSSSSNNTNKTKQKFSFLKTLDRRASAPAKMNGDFISFSGSSSLLTGGSSLVSSSSSSSSSNMPGEKRTISLADLERSKKKEKKRKTMGPSIPSAAGGIIKKPNLGTSGTGSSLGLGKLQNLFSTKK